tara:strand:+ start:418 stop:861 length:444 start_codon:yes stop_codon:yes gene_type:complete
MSEVFELVIKYHALIFLLFGIIILIGTVGIYFNNPITIEMLAKVISSNCKMSQTKLNKLDCDLRVEYNDPVSFKLKETDVVLKDQDENIKINENVIIDTINYISSSHIIFNLLIGVLLIYSAFTLYFNNKNKSLQKYIGAASIVNLI